MEDIVTKLYQWGLPYVVERVFSYLDYSDIKNAILVSNTWSNILNDSEVNVWKALWERNIDQVPAWSLLYKRAICQRSCKLRNDPDWNFREACHFIGDAHQQLLFNWRHGICKEKWEVTRGVDRGYCGISSTKVVKSRLQGPTQVTEITSKITIHDRWCLDENGVEIDTNPDNQHSHIIPRFEMNEQYLVVTTAQGSVSIWNLERNEKLHEFSPPLFMDSLHCAVLNVRLNNELLIMCTLYKKTRSFRLSNCCNVATNAYRHPKGT